MVINFPLKNQSLHTKNENHRNPKKKVKPKRKSPFISMISLIFIISTAIYITRTSYVCSNSKNLQFAVEYNLTTGFSSKNKLLRVQTMSLVYNDGENAIVKSFGLSKTEPHQNTYITGSFKKDSYGIWCLEKILDD